MTEIPISSREDLLATLATQFPNVTPGSEDPIETWNEGYDLFKSKKYYKAKQKFKALIVSDPNDHFGYDGLAQVYKAQGKNSEALFLIEEAIRLAQPDLENGSMDIEVIEEFQAMKTDLEKLTRL